MIEAGAFSVDAAIFAKSNILDRAGKDCGSVRAVQFKPRGKRRPLSEALLDGGKILTDRCGGEVVQVSLFGDEMDIVLGVSISH